MEKNIEKARPLKQGGIITVILHYERWYINDKLSREDGPAETVWRNDGDKDNETWYKNGKRHRIDGPAKIVWHENGKSLKNGIKITTGLPYFTEWNENGETIMELSS